MNLKSLVIVFLFLIFQTKIYSQGAYFEHPLEEHNIFSFIDFYSSYRFYNYADEVVEMKKFKEYEKVVSKNKIRTIKIDTYSSSLSESIPQTRYCYFDKEGRYLLNTDSSTILDTARRTERCVYKDGNLVSIRQKLRATYYDSNSYDYQYDFQFDKKSGLLSREVLSSDKTSTNYYYDNQNRLARMEYMDSAAKTIVKYLYTDTTILVFVNDTLSPAKWVIDEKNKRIKSYSDSRGGFKMEYSGNNYFYTDFNHDSHQQYSTADGCAKFISRIKYSNSGCVNYVSEIEYNPHGLITQYTFTEFYEGRMPSVTTQKFSYTYF